MIFAFLLGCLSPQPSESTLSMQSMDQQAYLMAMNLEGNAAINECNRIQDPDLQGECIWFVARGVAAKRQDSRGLCNLAPTTKWKEVCYFDVIDSLGLTGQHADDACAHTGEFQARCMIHALLREEDILSSRYPEGQEQEMMSAIRSRMEKLGVLENDEEDIDVVLTARIMARRFESRWRGQPKLLFSAQYCRNVSEEVCINAYRIAIKQIGRGRLPSNCALPMDANRVSSMGLPIWSDDLQEPIQQAWKSLCHATYGPKKPPDYASSQRAQGLDAKKSNPPSHNQ